MESPDCERDFVAVSYTHLDVYKRQVLRLGHALEQEIGVDIHRKVLEMRRTISPIRECELVD